MKTGKKVSFNKEELLSDLKSGMSYSDAIKKYSVTYKTISNYRTRYLNDKAVRIPKTEKILRALERLEVRFGKDELKKAVDLFL